MVAILSDNQFYEQTSTLLQVFSAIPLILAVIALLIHWMNEKKSQRNKSAYIPVGLLLLLCWMAEEGYEATLQIVAWETNEDQGALEAVLHNCRWVGYIVIGLVFLNIMRKNYQENP